MAAPAWATDLTDIQLDPTVTTNWAALGGGASGLAADTDFYIQGTTTPSCLSKAAWTNAEKGMIYTPGGTWTIPTDGVVMAWIIYSPAVASLDTKANGGLRMLVGTSSTAYKSYYIGGKDTLVFDSWVPAVVNYAGATSDATVGTPGTPPGSVGALAKLPTTSGPTKGAPLGVDAMRYGRHTLTYTLGDGAPNYNTFALAEATANSIANRWGNMEYSKGVYLVQGFHSFGSSGTAVDFRDSNKVLFIRASGANGSNDMVTTGYNRFEVRNASSNVAWTNVSISALGTRARGVFVHTAGTLTLDSCAFTDMGTFSFLAAASVTTCVFRRTNAITAPGTTLTSSEIRVPTVAADTSGLVWNVATDPDGKLDNMIFTKGTNAHHAIEMGTSSPTTMTLRGIDFSGFNAANAANDSVLHIKRTTGTVTVNVVGGSGTVSYKTGGATVSVVVNPVTLSVHVQDINTAAAISGARVWVPVTSSAGGKPYNASVTATAATTTATITHASHGLATNDWVWIQGATQSAYNGTFKITVTGTGSYTYTMASSPTSPATGTITATFVVISTTTDGSGNASASYTYSAAQTIGGRVRTATGAGPYYKTAPISGSISSTAGLSVTVQMIPDS